MRLSWTPGAWEDYVYWQQVDRKLVQKINELLRDALRNPFTGIGKPEPLKGNLTGCWSRRISGEHRLVYRVENGMLVILQCRFHY